MKRSLVHRRDPRLARAARAAFAGLWVAGGSGGVAWADPIVVVTPTGTETEPYAYSSPAAPGQTLEYTNNYDYDVDVGHVISDQAALTVYGGFSPLVFVNNGSISLTNGESDIGLAALYLNTNAPGGTIVGTNYGSIYGDIARASASSLFGADSEESISLSHLGGAMTSGSQTVDVVLGGNWGFAGMRANSAPPPDTGANAGAVSLDAQADITSSWNLSGSSDDTYVYGVVGASTGSNGVSSGSSGVNGQAGGSGGPVTVTVGNDATITAAYTNTGSFGVSGAAISARSVGGTGGAGNEGSTSTPNYGGDGGNAGWEGETRTAVTITDATLVSQGDSVLGVEVQNLAGGGGSGINADHSYGGNGGTGGSLSVNVTDTGGDATSISTSGSGAPAIYARARGGVAGNAVVHDSEDGGQAGVGGVGGDANEVALTLDGNIQITTQNAVSDSAGIIAVAAGGNGGTGGTEHIYGPSPTDPTDPPPGGDGGSTQEVTVSLANGVAVSTTGSGSYGIAAQASGGNGGTGGVWAEDFDGSAFGGNGGAGGSSSTVGIELDASSSVQTTGADAVALLARGLSGQGGAGGDASEWGGSTSGPGGASGNVGAITVSNDGTLATQGDSAIGILAQASVGAGGSAGDVGGFSLFLSDVGDSGSNGTADTVTVSHGGSITTAGDGAAGLVAQSLSGGGGSVPSTGDSIVALGGSSAAAGDAGAVTLNQSGTIGTSGDYAHGATLQSIGGGGGNGGESKGIVSIGGSSGGGGAGAAVTADLTGGPITTQGLLSHGLLAQSVGGGGGSSGDAYSISAEIGLAIGGSGGSGGNGGTVNVSSGADISTGGTKSIGILAQSIGGGGGNGGAGYTLTDGLGIAAAVAVGGSGGNGGDASTATVTTTGGTIWAGAFDVPEDSYSPYPVDNFGVVAQSIGGGGGNGGSAAAAAFAAAVTVPVDPEDGAFIVASSSVSVAVGGSGGDGGNADDASVSLTGDTLLLTQGQGSHGVIAQSIGGGGGNGGDSTAIATSFNPDYILGVVEKLTDAPNYSMSANVDVSLGGSGGTPGDAASATAGVEDASAIYTAGDYANAVVVQSIGGGGGNAGIGSGNAKNYGASYEMNATIDLGGSGGGGGDGDEAGATLASGAAIKTYGSSAAGILAQSIGGGGGTSQGGMVGVTAGGTTPEWHDVSLEADGTLDLGLGATSGAGGDGGVAQAEVQGSIETYGDDSTGVLLQSIGGGGGLAGTAGDDASADAPISFEVGSFGVEIETPPVRTFLDIYFEHTIPIDFTVTHELGSQIAGASGNGGAVNFALGSNITTHGDWAHGTLLQSIGGGGGKSGSATTNPGSTATDLTMNLGSADSTATGGDITITLASGAGIQTEGRGAYGLVAQSIGGGGGMALDGSASAEGTLTLGANGSSGVGGDVVIEEGAAIEMTTTGDGAHGVVLQSIGGGGGIAGTGNGGSDPADSAIDVVMGSAASNLSASGTITLNGADLNVSTQGDDAYGVVLQAISGGGGIAAVDGPGSVTFAGNVNDGTVPDATYDFGGGSAISTTGDRAFGVVIQSLGGGGGIAGYATGDAALTTTVPDSGGTNVYDGADVGELNVALASGASIQTSGDFAHGMIVQSLGGAGGIMPTAVGQLYLGGVPGSTLTWTDIGDVTVAVDGSIQVSGERGSVALFVQSGGATLSKDTPTSVGPITVTLGSGAEIVSEVTDGTAAVWIDGGGLGNALTLNQGAVLTADTAVYYNGKTALSVRNAGTLAGSLTQSEEVVGPIGFVNESTGVYRAGTSVQANVTNDGRIEVGAGTPAGASGQTTITGNLNQSDTGTLHVEGDASAKLTVAGTTSVDGQTTVSGATLESIGALTVGDAADGALTVKDGGTVSATTVQIAAQVGSTSSLNVGEYADAAEANNAGGSLTATTITFGDGSGSLNFNQSDEVTVAADISGSGDIHQRGTGITRLTGSITVDQATTVSAGTLIVDGTMSSSVNVASGATLEGSGIVGGLIIAEGGTLAPGNSPGIMETGDLTLGGTFVAEIAGDQPGSGYDQVQVTGIAEFLPESLLTLELSYLPTADELFFLIVNDGTDGIIGLLDGYEQGDYFVQSGALWRISYEGDSDLDTWTGGNDLAVQFINSVPEPSSAALLLIGLWAFAIRRPDTRSRLLVGRREDN